MGQTDGAQSQLNMMSGLGLLDTGDIMIALVDGVIGSLHLDHQRLTSTLVQCTMWLDGSGILRLRYRSRIGPAAAGSAT